MGLYSISVRGFEIGDLLVWAAQHAVPFVHLRGGPRGFDLASRSTARLRHWHRLAQRTVPITGVTADTDLADLVSGEARTRRAACDQVHRLCEAACHLGAQWVRLLARTPLTHTSDPRLDYVLPDTALPLLVELHHARWLDPDAFTVLEALMGRCGDLRLLADTAQLGAALAAGCDRGVAAAVLDRSNVLHLSDNGHGLAGASHEEIATLAAHRLAQGQPMEVAMEWTGADRCPETCLARYHSAVAWWSQIRARVEAVR